MKNIVVRWSAAKTRVSAAAVRFAVLAEEAISAIKAECGQVVYQSEIVRVLFPDTEVVTNYEGGRGPLAGVMVNHSGYSRQVIEGFYSLQYLGEDGVAYETARRDSPWPGRVADWEAVAGVLEGTTAELVRQAAETALARRES